VNETPVAPEGERNSLSVKDALRAYARAVNTLSVEALEPLLAADFVYESQAVLTPLKGKEAFLAYFVQKLAFIREQGSLVFAEMGLLPAPYPDADCVIVA
jgi:hypothetical protein